MIKTLFFSFVLIALVACQSKPGAIYLAGDSTMSVKDPIKFPETGWGMAFPAYLDTAIHVHNHAKNGRSTRTFIEEGRWDSLLAMVQPGDYVFIQFGHNDQSKHKVDRYTPPAAYMTNLERFVKDVRAKKGEPVLLTPLARRRFNEQGQFYDVHGEYPDLVRQVAASQDVPLLDVHLASCALLKQLGDSASKELFLIAEPGVLENYPLGIDDNTHFSVKGADEMAKLVVEAIQRSDLRLKKYLVTN